MNYLLPAIAIIAMIGTALVTLTMIVCCMAMGANASPAEIRTLKLWMGGFALLGLTGIIVSILLMRVSEHGWAAGAAFLPTVIMGLITIIALLK